MKKEFPIVGLGTYGITGSLTEPALKSAIDAGYVHIDTAQMYNNEDSIGRALTNLGVDKSKLFITSKVLPVNFSRTRQSVMDSLSDLEIEKIDLMLLHAPAAAWNIVVNAYRELMALREEGFIDRIGVSNFSVKQLKDLKNEVGEFPFVNQVIATPTAREIEVEVFAKENGIELTGYSTMMPYFKSHYMAKQMTSSQKAFVDSLASKYNKLPGQILLRWAIQLGYHVIPKSANAERQKLNMDIFDFELTNEEMKEFDTFNTSQNKWFA